MSDGWVKIHRKILGHWLLSNPEYFSAWVIILMEVNHAPRKVLVGNKLLDCKRGERLYSLDTWAGKFPGIWDRSKVRRFFKLLQSDSMIVSKRDTNTTRLTVCNYEPYQESNLPYALPVTSVCTQSRKEKNEKKEEEEYGRKSFAEFWDLYDKKRGKPKALELWMALSREDQDKALAHTPAYVRSTPNKSKRKDPERYIRRRAFEDEIISHEEKPVQGVHPDLIRFAEREDELRQQQPKITDGRK
jgi:hypothetical protein